MTTATTPPPAPAARAEALNDGLAVSDLICGLFFWPLGLLFGHLSNRAARRADRKRSPLAVTGLVLSYAWLDLTATVIVGGTVSSPAAMLIPTVLIAAGAIGMARRARPTQTGRPGLAGARPARTAKETARAGARPGTVPQATVIPREEPSHDHLST